MTTFVHAVIRRVSTARAVHDRPPGRLGRDPAGRSARSLIIVGLLLARASASTPPTQTAKGTNPSRPTTSDRAAERRVSASDAFDVGADADQAADQVVVAAVDVVDTADRGLAVGRQAGDHQRRPGTDVGRPHRRTAEPRHATHHGVVAVGADVGAEPLQLLDVAEPPGIEVLGDDADAVGDRQAW